MTGMIILDVLDNIEIMKDKNSDRLLLTGLVRSRDHRLLLQNRG